MARLNIGAARAFIQIEGMEAVRRRLQRASKEVLKDCEPVLRNEAAHIMVASRSGIPVETGDLAGSGFIAPGEASKGGESMTVTCGYEAPYAAQAHEGFYGFPGVKDRFRMTGTPPKFLERAADGRGGALAKKVGAAMMRALRRLEQQ